MSLHLVPADATDDQASRQAFNAVPYKQFIALALPPRALLLEPWLPEKGLAMVYAPRGVGKTWFALGTSFAVATGTSFLGFNASAAKRVVYLDGEMPAVSMQERLRAIAKGFGKEPAPEELFKIISGDLSEEGLPDLCTEDGQRQIDQAIGDADLIIVDNISTLCRSGKENEAESWQPVQEWALAHRRRGRTVLFVHHSGKSGAQRGTSRREDILDTVIALRHPDGYSAADGARFEVHFEKCRGFHGEEAEPFEVAFDVVEGAANWVEGQISSDDRTRTAEALLDNGASARAVAQQTGLTRHRVIQIRDRLAAGGKLGSAKIGGAK